MSAPKFTPGPWISNGYRIEGAIDPRSKHKSGRVLVGGVVDEMNDWSGTPSESIDDRSAFKAETIANARLIAAAPELYAACAAIVAAKDAEARYGLSDTQVAHDWAKAIDAARSALGKAGGA